MKTQLDKIEDKVLAKERLSYEDGLCLMESSDLSRIGYLADSVRKQHSENFVYFNVNQHINLTNICTSRCRFCAFGCDADSSKAYAMDLEDVLSIAHRATQDPDLRELHIVSGLHPDWPFEYYVSVLHQLKQELPHLHLKAFTAVEICYFAKIAGFSVQKVLTELQKAGLDSMPGGGAEILSSRVRSELCPNKASSQEWLDVHRTAHDLGIPTTATMLYGHIETVEERIRHFLSLRELQDQTNGFQTFIALPFHPLHTELEDTITRTSPWEDLKTCAIARLMLDNFPHIKAYWIMLTLPIAQMALSFGADDLDGTVREEKITHAAGAKTSRGLTKNTLVDAIREVGRIPVERDSLYQKIRVL